MKKPFKRLTAKQQVEQIERKRIRQQLAGVLFVNTVSLN
jgi:hypothetical protein